VYPSLPLNSATIALRDLFIFSSEWRVALRVGIATSSVEELRRPLESAQYVSIRYTDRLANAGIEPSVGSVGDWPNGPGPQCPCCLERAARKLASAGKRSPVLL
jgi:hypothetical protein